MFCKDVWTHIFEVEDDNAPIQLLKVLLIIKGNNLENQVWLPQSQILLLFNIKTKRLISSLKKQNNEKKNTVV